MFRVVPCPDVCSVAGHVLSLWVPASGLAIEHPYGDKLFWGIMACFFLAHVVGCRQWWVRISLRLPMPLLGFTYVLALILCMVMAPIFEKPFLYMNF